MATAMGFSIILFFFLAIVGIALLVLIFSVLIKANRLLDIKLEKEKPDKGRQRQSYYAQPDQSPEQPQQQSSTERENET